jgi:hypothetical protein
LAVGLVYYYFIIIYVFDEISPMTLNYYLCSLASSFLKMYSIMISQIYIITVILQCEYKNVLKFKYCFFWKIVCFLSNKFARILSILWYQFLDNLHLHYSIRLIIILKRFKYYIIMVQIQCPRALSIWLN